MRITVITRPDFFDGEPCWIEALLRAGLPVLHLRKPGATEAQTEALLRAIPAEFHGRIMLHDHFGLARRYTLRGIHLNGRNPEPPAGYCGRISRSCHTLDEVRRYKDECEYVTLSPIFDSISKRGYASAFTVAQLAAAQADGTIDDRVTALGGITADNLPQVERMGFGGAALLGAIWNAGSAAEAAMMIKEMLAKTGRMCGTAKVLSIAGSDPSGGAGIQADIKTVTALGGYAATAITALTIQNTEGVRGVFPVPAATVAEQIAAVMDDIEPQAVKIGMVNDAAIVHAIAATIRKYAPRHVVFDPVMVSTSGHRLIEDKVTEVLEDELIPLATIITPNMSEAEVLWRQPIGSVGRMETAAAELAARYGTSVLVKGGHLSGDMMCDVLCHEGGIHRFAAARIATRNLHGTGCTLSSAIATLLAQGRSMREAVGEAKRYVGEAIEAGSRMAIGHGNGPLWHAADRLAKHRP